MKRAICLLSLTASMLACFLFSMSVSAATITVKAKRLAGQDIRDANIAVTNAVTGNSVAVIRDGRIDTIPNVSASRLPTGELKIDINDPNVQALNIEVTADDAVPANLRNVFVSSQSITVALPRAIEMLAPSSPPTILSPALPRYPICPPYYPCYPTYYPICYPSCFRSWCH